MTKTNSSERVKSEAEVRDIHEDVCICFDNLVRQFGVMRAEWDRISGHKKIAGQKLAGECRSDSEGRFATCRRLKTRRRL